MPYKHFSSDDRDALQVMKDRGLAMNEIARILCKHESSLFRELKRNKCFGSYIAGKAHALAQHRRRLSRPAPVGSNRLLICVLRRLFEYDFSPEQIAGRIKQELGYLPSWHISHETIYKYLYDQIQKGLTTNKHFRHGHKARKRRRANKDGRGSIPGRRFIDERPPIADMKLRRGDWEGDTIEGAQKKGYVATFVDRKTKYLIAFRLLHKTAAAMEAGILKAFSSIPTSMARTITVDNGKEFASHENIAQQLKTKIYFAHPYHSWERGLNEHTNGLLRQYLPKNISLDHLSDKELAKIVDRINNRPRKSLGYRTPREAFFNLPLALQI